MCACLHWYIKLTGSPWRQVSDFHCPFIYVNGASIQAVETRMSQTLLSRGWKSSRSIKTGRKIAIMTRQMNRQRCWGPEAEGPEAWGRIRGLRGTVWAKPWRGSLNCSREEGHPRQKDCCAKGRDWGEGGSDHFCAPEIGLREYSAGFLESLRCQSEESRDTPVGIKVLTEVSKQGNSMFRHVLFCFFQAECGQSLIGGKSRDEAIRKWSPSQRWIWPWNLWWQKESDFNVIE